MSKKDTPASVEQWKKTHEHIFTTKKVQAKKDLSFCVKFPLNVRIQRQRAILKQRIKVPAVVNQFAKTLKKDQAATLFQLLGKYRPETQKEKATRLKTVAAGQAADEKTKATPKPKLVKFGLNHVTSLVETKKAKLVVIAHDVDPIELVVWLPTLCRKMDIPFVIVKGKSRLGYLVHKKQASVLALTDVDTEDLPKLAQISDAAKAQFGLAEKKTGGLKLSTKSLKKIAAKEAAAKNTIKA